MEDGFGYRTIHSGAPGDLGDLHKAIDIWNSWSYSHTNSDGRFFIIVVRRFASGDSHKFIWNVLSPKRGARIIKCPRAWIVFFIVPLAFGLGGCQDHRDVWNPMQLLCPGDFDPIADKCVVKTGGR